MKTEYNKEQLNEICKQIFQRYVGSPIKLFKPDSNEFLPLTIYRMHHIEEFGLWIDHPLQLKKIESITKEDLKTANFSSKSAFKYHFEISALNYDLFRLMGYATLQTVLIDSKPLTLTVEKQIELGIIEIIK